MDALRPPGDRNSILYAGIVDALQASDTQAARPSIKTADEGKVADVVSWQTRASKLPSRLTDACRRAFADGVNLQSLASGPTLAVIVVCGVFHRSWSHDQV